MYIYIYIMLRYTYIYIYIWTVPGRHPNHPRPPIRANQGYIYIYIYKYTDPLWNIYWLRTIVDGRFCVWVSVFSYIIKCSEIGPPPISHIFMLCHCCAIYCSRVDVIVVLSGMCYLLLSFRCDSNTLWVVLFTVLVSIQYYCFWGYAICSSRFDVVVLFTGMCYILLSFRCGSATLGVVLFTVLVSM